VRVAGHQLPLNGSFGRWNAGFVLDGTPTEGVAVRVLVDEGADPWPYGWPTAPTT
jgi:hypothetical protein